jgi:hypothetical protein
LEGSVQARQIFKHAQPTQGERRLATFGECRSNQIRIGPQHWQAQIVRGQLVNRTTHGIKRAANGLFQGFFEGLILHRNGPGGIAQTVQLTRLVCHARENHRGSQLKRLLIVAHQATDSVAQIFHGLEQLGGQGLMRRGEQSRLMEDQSELQLAHDVQRRVTLFGLEGIDRHKESMPTKVRRMFFQTEIIRAAQQDEKHLNQVQHLSLGDEHVTFLGQQLVNLRNSPAFPEAPCANLDNDFQRKAAPANRQAARRLRFIHAIPPGTFRIRATVTQADDQIPSVQENDILPPQRITTLQGLTATRTNQLFGSIVARGYLVIVFGLSHRHPDSAQGLCKTAFYLAEGV